MGDKISQGNEIELDVRGLQAPEPLVRILEALDALPSGSVLRVLHHREPFPLYAVLQEEGYRYRTGFAADGHIEITIWR